MRGLLDPAYEDKAALGKLSVVCVGCGKDDRFLRHPGGDFRCECACGYTTELAAGITFVPNSKLGHARAEWRRWASRLRSDYTQLPPPLSPQMLRQLRAADAYMYGRLMQEYNDLGDQVVREETKADLDSLPAQAAMDVLSVLRGVYPDIVTGFYEVTS
jgi:hypothetical protein